LATRFEGDGSAAALPVRATISFLRSCTTSHTIHMLEGINILHGRVLIAAALSEANFRFKLPVCRNGFDVTCDLGGSAGMKLDCRPGQLICLASVLGFLLFANK